MTPLRLNITLCWFFLLFGLITGCRKSQQIEPKELPTPLPTPTFLQYIEPAPGSIIRMDDFEGVKERICVRLDGIPVLEYDDVGLEPEDFLVRSTLIIDGQEWTDTEGKILMDMLGLARARKIDPDTGRPIQDPKTGLFVGEGYNAVGPFVICWQDVKLNEGLHTAEFQTRNTSGDIYSYGWNFYISDP